MKLNPASINRLALLFVLASIMRPAMAQETYTFSAKQAVDYALKNSVNVRNALKDIEIQLQQNREITSAAYPQISGNINVTDYLKLPTQLIPAEFFGGQPGTFQPVQFGTKYNGTYGASLNQVLFDGQVFVGLQARATSIQWAQKNVEVTEELIKANVYKVYYQLVASKTQIHLLDANIDRLQKLHHDTYELFKNGFAEKLDVDKIEVQIANLETEKKKTLNQISNGYLGLKLLIGMPMKDQVILKDTLSDEQIKRGMLEASDYNYSDRKEYQYAELGKKLNEFNIKRYQLSQIPTVSLSGAWSKNAQRNKFDFFGKGDWFTFSNIGLHISVPLFHGFYTRSKIDEARLTLKKTENQIENLKLSIDNEVQTAQTNYRTAIEAMDYQKQNMKLAEDVYEQTKKKYEAGLGSNTEITAAQTDLKAAQTNYINALYDAIVARIDYLKAIGKL